jgi:hypothetical protein
VTPRKQYQLLLCSPHPLKMSRLFHLFVQNMIWPAVESLTQYFTVLENFYFAKWLIIHESYVVLHSDWTIMITHLLHANCILVRWLPILFLCWQAFDGSCFKRVPVHAHWYFYPLLWLLIDMLSMHVNGA